MPPNPSRTGETRSTATDGDNAFASLLETEIDAAETPAATTQPYSTVAPAVQLQTLASTGASDDAIAGLIAPAAASSETDAGASPPTASSTAPAMLDGAVADLLVANGSASAPAETTPQLSALAVTTVPAATAGGTADTDAETEVSEANAQGGGEAAATTAPAASAAPASALAVLPAATAGLAQTATEANGATAQPVTAAPDSAAASDAAPADTTETAPANPAGRASATQTPNQPAAAAAAAQSSAAVATDTAAAKPDFAAVLASQSTQGADAPAQTATQTSETLRTTPTPAALQAAPAATVQVYNRIIERADGRAQRFEIRLDPAELGRVDVRIEIGADRKVHAVLAAHDSAALSDLMRGQRALERALADAGFDLADNGVRFELARDNGSSGANQQRDSDGRPAQADVWRRFDAMTMPATEETAAAVRPSWRPQRLDLVA